MEGLCQKLFGKMGKNKMSLLKKIIFYNSPQNVITRFKAYNTKQKWLFVDAIVMFIFVLYFLKTDLMFMVYVCIGFSGMSVFGIYLTKDK